MALLYAQVSVRLPRWWRACVVLCWFWHVLRGTKPDVYAIAGFITRHAKIKVR